jgi:membrane-bound ClpP family serine protease
MTGLGIGLLLAGVVLLVAEAHISGGVLGALGLVAAVTGTVLAIEGSGGGLVLGIVLAAIVAAIGVTSMLLVARTLGRTIPRRVRSGREALVGAPGRAREALGDHEGHVLVEGALWRARNSSPEEPVEAGDPIVVERIDGLTLTVRRADPWELVP